MKNYHFLFFPLILLLLMVNLSFTSFKGGLFPSLTAENLDSKNINVPTDTKGKYTLIGLAYSQKAQQDLQTWLQPIYENFIAKPTKPVLFDETYDVNLYLIMMFTGSNEGMAGTAKKKMQQDLDPELKPHVLLYKGDISTYKEKLSLSEKDKPYFFVLDEEGKIVHSTSGAYSEAKMGKIEELLEE